MPINSSSNFQGGYKCVEFFGGPYDGKMFHYTTVITTKLWLSDDMENAFRVQGGELLHEYKLVTLDAKPHKYEYSGPLRLIDGNPVYE